MNTHPPSWNIGYWYEERDYAIRVLKGMTLDTPESAFTAQVQRIKRIEARIIFLESIRPLDKKP